MTKSDIADRISQKCGFTKKESQDILESFFSIIKNTLEAGEDLKVSGFGKFEVRQKKDRIGRNPQTGESITINARRVLTFKPSSLLKSLVNGNNTR